MKYIPIVAGILLGLLFLLASVPFLLNMMPEQKLEGTIKVFMEAFGPTGYMKFVKVLELLGGILVAIPKTRNFGLLILVPIIVNIVVFHFFISGWGDAKDVAMVSVVVVLPLYLIWVARKQIVGLLN